MKTVFSNHAQCAHVWAAQTQSEGRSGPLWFDGPTIYSYGRHYAVATFMRPDVVLFNSTGSTPTTQGKHKVAVRRALIGHAARVFDVPGVAFGRRPAEIIPFLVSSHTDALECAARSRKYTERNLERAETFADDAREFARLFDLPAPALAEFDRDAIRARIAEQAKANAAERAERKLQAQRDADEKRAEYDAALKDWRLGKPNLPYWADAPTALRVSTDGALIETSRRASVPVRDARNLWGLIASCHAQQCAKQFGGPLFEFGGFALREIRADGTAIVGCHELQYSETHALAIALGWAQ